MNEKDETKPEWYEDTWDDDDTPEEHPSLEQVSQQITELQNQLAAEILGQDSAIRRFVHGYAQIHMSASKNQNRPAAFFLLAGPPGVGKTFLAVTAAQKLNYPFKRFDMSEYSGHNALEGLIGFEKTWRDSVPGVLTSFADKNPRSIILFDEIEKAYPTVLRAFLQVLDGARLKDKYTEKTVSFTDTILIFTTNCGRDLYENNEDTNLSRITESEILQSLKNDNDFPDELCSRFASGNIIMFNHLSPHNLCEIVKKKMNASVNEIQKQFGICTSFDEMLPELFLFHNGGGSDARTVSSQSSVFIQNHLLALADQFAGQKDVPPIQQAYFEIDLPEDNKDVYQLLHSVSADTVLVASASKYFDFEHIVSPPDNKPQIVFSNMAEELPELLHNNKFSCALVDLSCLPDQTDYLDTLHKKAPRLPVYVIDTDSSRTENRNVLSNDSIKGFFQPGKSSLNCMKRLHKLTEQLAVQKNLDNIKRAKQQVDFKTQYQQRSGTYVIRFYDFSIRKMNADDAALRKMVKELGVSDFERPTLRFSDIIGAENVKEEMEFFINYINHTDTFLLEGAETPRGILLYGIPGTGKTSLAKALAGECGIPFFNTTGADILNANNPVERIKGLFKIARNEAPSIIFIDEVDVIAGNRMRGSQQNQLIVNTLLTEMEGFHDHDPYRPVFVIAATNFFPDEQSPEKSSLDPALLRRFDKCIELRPPRDDERKDFLRLQLKKKGWDKQIAETDIQFVVKHTRGKSLAVITKIIQSMAKELCNSTHQKTDSLRQLLTEACLLQVYGPEYRLSDKTLYRVAVHESGHAYVGWKLNLKLNFMMILPRGNQLGITSYDSRPLCKQEYLDRICSSLGGRAAEMVYFQEKGIGNGIRSDILFATRMAVDMVCRLAMGDHGIMYISTDSQLLPPEVREEVNQILTEQLNRAQQIIIDGKDAMDSLASELVKQVWLDGNEITSLLENAEQPEETAETEETAVTVESTPAVPESSKQKPARKQKWYVVVNGRRPGLYRTWEECLKQVHHYSNALYRSYPTKEEAQDAMRTVRLDAGVLMENGRLYHMMTPEELKTAIQKNAITGTKRFGNLQHLPLDFHPYTRQAAFTRWEHPQTDYIYIEVSPVPALQPQLRLLTEYPLHDHPNWADDYQDGISQIDQAAAAAQDNAPAEAPVISCLCEQALPLAYIQTIYVRDKASADRINDMLTEAFHPEIVVQPLMFF